MANTEFTILALMMISMMLSIIFFISWYSFGRQRHAFVWGLTFALGIVQWGSNFLYKIEGLFPTFVHYWMLVSALSYVGALLGLTGYLLRAGKRVPVRWFVLLTVVAEIATYFTAMPGGHFGLTVAISPALTTCTASFAAWVLFSAPKKKNGAEWAAIVANIVFVLTQIALVVIALKMGANRDPEMAKLFGFVLFLTLPTAFTGVGLFMVTVMAADLAEKVQELAAKEQGQLKAQADRYWNTLQEVIGVIPDLVSIDDGTGHVAACNESFARFLGRDKESIIGRSILEMLGEVGGMFYSVDGKAADGHGALVAEGLYRSLKSGDQLTLRLQDERTFLVDCAPVKAGGNILLARDVSDLLHAKTQLDDAIASMPMAFAFFDVDGKLIACNHGMEKLHDQDRAWIAEQTMESLLYDLLDRLKSVNGVPTDMQDGWHEAGVLEALTTGSTNFLGELQDGTWHQISSRRVESGGFVVIAHDVTQRRQLEMSLEKNEAQLREVLKGQPFPVLILRNRDNCILFASSAAEDVLGASRNQLIGAYADKFAEGETPLFIPGSQDDDGGQGKLGETTFRRLNGETFPALYSGHSLFFQGNAATVMSFIDLADQKRLERELKDQREALFQSEKLNALGTLLAGVAHELNNPLTVVVANAHVLSMSSDDPALTARVEKITNAAERCSNIVRTFLAMARKGQGEKRPFQMKDAIESALGICRFGFKEHDVSLASEISADLPVIEGDADQVAQVVINLLINAQHALMDQDEPRKVLLRCYHDPLSASICLDVADNGPGIPADIRPKIFDPFFTTKQVGSGTGLGLFLVSGTVKTHGGRIELLEVPLSSEYGGACFRVCLPIGTAREVEPREHQQEPSGIAKQHVLIVDDEPDILDVLTDILTAGGHTVVAVPSGAEALDYLADHQVDMLVSDLRMPGMSGPELFDMLKSDYPDLVGRTAFMTGDNLSQEAGRFLKNCGRPVLNKPFAPHDVATLMADIFTDEQAD